MSQASPETRPRAHTSMSFSSQRTHKSSASGHKLELTESEKDKKRLHTKADPSRALSEATPAEQALEAATVEDLRGMTHKDMDGNVITDPDRSNPTRYRLERPLDTIRSFNAAAEGTSSRRSSFNSRPFSQMGHPGDTSRRASYYSANGFSPQARPRPSPSGGYYRNSSYGFGPQSSVEESPGASQMYGRRQNSYYGAPNGPQNGYLNGYQNGYNGESPVSAHSYQHSYETMTSGSEEYGKSTNPSSQNSSFDQLHQLSRPKLDGNDRNYSPENPYANELKFSQPAVTNKPFAPYNMNDGMYAQNSVPVNMAPNNPRQPIKLGGSGDGMDSPPESPQKKQSWIKRRFSRRDH
ncbi:hypothetical protein H2204_002829 [Knufia peltigerae]|uniref:Uncharacterized protein n=1 Tax=Knufia peltigerae TaxID=1002370 RepID=A0AA38YAC1_9EURO|nr:hypothetical protein H2204_002829 [Knufia peltigerae]